MIEFVSEYGLFLAKSATVVVAILVIVGASVSMSRRGKQPEKLEVVDLNEKYDNLTAAIRNQVLPKKELKRLAKEAKAERKAREKRRGDAEKRTYVLRFHGDIKATNVASLREEITAVLTMATSGDEVLVILDNSGGVVHEHGLAASQLQRLRDAGVRTVVAVDKVAASGGYMMACVADRIIAAPFAVVGSIGVLAQLPNFNELLERQGIRFEQQTAGEYKRTITMFGKNTDAEREKLKEQIEETHELFKDFVHQYRPGLDMAEIATGEHWYGKRALELGLVDEICTSDDYLLKARAERRLFEISFTPKKSVVSKLMNSIQHALAAIGLAPRSNVDPMI